jgi:flavin-dependent dehydrogenase
MRIAIVGAGPAGCHLAYRLGACSSGTGGTEHKIVLFDHRVCLLPQMGYEKPCGGGLSPLAVHRFPDVMELSFPRTHPQCLTSLASDGGRAEYTLESSEWAMVSRADLGQALLERTLSNGHVRHIHQRVVGIEQTAEGWSLRTSQGESYPADFLVGADGVRSLVRRHLVGPIPRQNLGLAVGYLVQGAPDGLVFQTYSDLEGYLWSFPRPHLASVGIGSRLGAESPRNLWQRLERFLDQECPGARKEGRYAALLPMAADASLWYTPCAGPGWALLGDAASHVHPLTGEGISYALWSAELLAEAFGQGEPQVYESLWRERYGDRLVAVAEMISRTHGDKRAFEIVFQLTLVMALGGTSKVHQPT